MTETEIKTYVFNVHMKCNNCLKKLSAALDTIKGKGIQEYEIVLEEQKVEVKATCPSDEILKLLRSTGKEVTLVSST